MSLYDVKGRQKLALPENAAVETGGNLDTLASAVPAERDVLRDILVELRLHTLLLCQGLNLSHTDAVQARNDLAKEI